VPLSEPASGGFSPDALSFRAQMAELPSGTVTFLFTDIEGSTRLLKQLGERYSQVLDAHRRILREAAAAREGREIDTQGDSFFFAFARANAAVGAAVAAQRAFAAHDWPEGGELRVRMGLHTGEPAVGEERYVGLGVHRAARIGAVANGGQVVLSGATRELVEDEVGGVSIRDLGSYRLKDIDRPERLYQLDIEGLQTDFPPLRAEKVAEPRPLRRRAILLAALAGVIAAAVAIPIFALGQGRGGRAIDSAAGNSVGLVDATSGRLVADVGVGATPARVAVGKGAYWVTNAEGDSVSRIDPVSRQVVDTIPVGRSPNGIVVGNGAVWVANSLDGTVSRIDPDTNKVVQVIDVGNGPAGIAYARSSIWVANTGDGTITRIDADSGKPATPLPIAATELTVGAGALWASEPATNQVARIDPSTGKVVQPITVGNGASGIAYGSGAAWVANVLDGTVSRVDPRTNSVRATIPVGNGPRGIAVGASGVWVSNEFDGTLVRIDPRTNQPARSLNVGNHPQGVAISGSDLLVSVRESGIGHRGGTLTVRMDRPLDSIDTAVAYDTTSLPILRMTGDGLVAFNQASGLAGAQLVPDLAVSLPAPSDRGRTYTFRLRPNVRYSTGRQVKASDFRSTFERDFEIGLPVAYYDGIVGAAGCRKSPERCDLSQGIVADDGANTLTFHLVAADPEFLYKLALPFAYVVPTGTPPRDVGTHPLPATGPYAIASYRAKHFVTLVRNQHFREWSQAAQPDGYPDEIDVKIGGTTDGAMADVVRGKADLISTFWSGTPSQDRLDALKIRYASEVHSSPEQGLWGLFLNTRVAPFDRLDVRRALSYAADRNAAVKVAGGPDVAQATCQMLPPDFPGYRPYCPYTLGTQTHGMWTAPDLAKARALVARSGTRGMKITVWDYAPVRGLGADAVQWLRSLGYRASLRVVGDKNPNYVSTVSDSRSGAQVGWDGWGSDYPAPSSFFDPILSCASFLPRNPDNQNWSEFCDPHIDRQIKDALTLQSVNPEAARALWVRIDRQVVDQAPWVPLVNPKAVDVLSKRVRNYEYSSAFGVLIDQLWVR
jgi:YVTN family beta-propeller protein